MTSRLVLAVLAAALLSACGRDEPAAPDAAPPPASETQPATAQPAPSAAPTPASGQAAAPPARRAGFGPHPPGTAAAGETGVAECDDLLLKYEACLSDKVPAESRGAMQTALESWRGSWRTLAASPTTRGNLPQTCKAAADSVRTQLTSYGCAL